MIAQSAHERVASLVALLDVQQTGTDRFLGPRREDGSGRAFGGQLIAQALAAVERTVDPSREVHSLHAYFLRVGNDNHEIDLAVEREYEGGSFSNRRVVASQQGGPVLTLGASFHKREYGVAHSQAMPEVPLPDDLLGQSDLMGYLEDRIGEVPDAVRAAFQRPNVFDIRPVDPLVWAGLDGDEPRLDIWFRAPVRLPDDPRIHRAVLAYASDMMLMRTSAAPHRLNMLGGEVVGGSLDHAMWFHDTFRADEWLFYTTDSPWAGHGRSFNRGRFFTLDGRLVAEAAQEGLMRRKRKSG